MRLQILVVPPAEHHTFTLTNVPKEPCIYSTKPIQKKINLPCTGSVRALSRVLVDRSSRDYGSVGVQRNDVELWI